MSTLKIVRLSTSETRFTDATPEVQRVLDGWADAETGVLTGDALCCVTMLTTDAGLLVSDRDPDAFEYAFAGVTLTAPSPGYHTHDVASDLRRLRALLVRTSELFMVRGPEIIGGRKIWVFGAGQLGRCELAVSLL